MTLLFFRRLLAFVLGGSLSGIILASWFAPWLLRTGDLINTQMVNRIECVNNTTRALINMQLWGGTLGSITGGLVGWVFLNFIRKMKNKDAGMKAPT